MSGLLAPQRLHKRRSWLAKRGLTSGNESWAFDTTNRGSPPETTWKVKEFSTGHKTKAPGL